MRRRIGRVVKTRRHGIIPDVQQTPGAPNSHLEWAGAYFADKLPDVIVCLGDFADFASLSSYDAGKLSSHGLTYRDDVESANVALEKFEKTLKRYAPRSYSPRKIITLGNHEDRVSRAVNDDPKTFGTLTVDDLHFKKHGWEVVPFLKPIEVDGILYCHYFCYGPNGRVVGSKFGMPSAKSQVQRLMQSATSGHKQGLDISIVHTPTKTYRGAIAGSFYQWEPGYLTPQARYWSGLLLKQDVRQGEYSLMEVDMAYLKRRYG